MDSNIIVALITGGLSFAGVVLSNNSSNKNVEKQLEKSQAVTDVKIEELTREVRTHNNFAQRVPVLEEKIDNMNVRMNNLERREK